jgi:iron complex outermembrane receptor protein
MTPDVLAYASIATGFKSGDFNGSFLSTNPAEIQRQLVPVSPEHVKAYEVGLKSTLLDRHLLIDAAAFYNDYRDMQVFVLINGVAEGSGLPLNVLDNAPKAHTEGLDLTITARPSANFTATLQAGVLQAKLDQYQSVRQAGLADYSGNQLPMAPHASGSLLLEYRVPIGENSLALQGNINYKSHVFFDTSNDPWIQQGGYWIGNVRAAYAFGTHWEFAAYVHNIANKEYYSDKFDLTSTFGFIQGIVGTPRMAGLEANWRY